MVRSISNRVSWKKTYLSVLSAINLIVPRDILVQSSKENHGYHSRKEENNHQGVQYAEPLDIRMRHRFQDVVPTRRPFDRVVLHEIHRISVHYFEFVVDVLRQLHGVYIRAVRSSEIVIDVIKFLRLKTTKRCCNGMRY